MNSRILTTALLAGFLVVAGCNSGSASSGGSSTATTGTTLQGAFDAAVTKGQLPALDMSDSIAGPDADHNGVRDDIDAYINSLTYSEVQKASIRQMAATYTLAMTADFSSDASVVSVANKVGRAIHCMNSQIETAQVHTLIRNLRKYSINTRARVDAYLKYAVALNGHELSVPEGNTCE